MGVCVSCCAAPSQEGGYRVKTTGDLRSQTNPVIFRVKAEIYSLSCDDESLKWIPLYSECVQICMECLQEGEIYVYSLYSSVKGKNRFSTKIYIPGTKLRQTSECFIQWRDWNDDAGAWGINFMSESDAAQFLQACSPPSLTPESARMRHAFSTLSLSVPIPAKAATSQLEHDKQSSVNKFVIDTLSEDAVSQNEEHEAVAQVASHTSASAIEKPDEVLSHNQVTSGESFLLPDVYVADLHNDESDTSFRRKSILFSEKCGSFEEGPSSPHSPPPEPLISSSMITSSDISSPRYSWLFSPNGSGFSNLNIDPPNLPLSSPPGKPLSPRASTTLIPLNLVPESNMHLSMLLSELPLAEIVMHELDEPTEGTMNESETSQNKDDKHFVGDTNCETESFASRHTSPTKSDFSKDQMQMTSDHSPRLIMKDLSVNKDSATGLETECQHLTKDNKQLTNHSSPLRENLVSDMHLTIESYVGSSIFTGSSGYHSDPTVQNLSYFQPPKRRESSSTAPTEVSNTSDETHAVGNICNSISTNSLNTLTTESEEDTISRSTIANRTDLPAGNNRTFSNSTISRAVESKHVAKAGFLEMKRMLIHRNQVVAMASRKQWKKYWAKLKGSTLIFYICENVSSISDEAPVSLRIDTEGCIAHPEHMKRDNVICLSTSLGDTYYLQTTSQAEVDSWIRAIHSVAVISLTKHLVKEESIPVLKERQTKIEEMIESENKLIKLAELQLSISNSASKEIITCKIEEWSKNIERLHVELYRHRCYLASLQRTELPNPQSLLANVLKLTKSALVKLGTFSVASVHAKVCARHGGMLTSLHRKTSATSIFKPSLGTSMNFPSNIKKPIHTKKKTSTLPRSKKEISRPSLSRDDNYTEKHFMSTESDSKPPTDHENFRDENNSKILKVQEGHPVQTRLADYIKVKMPDKENVIEINKGSTIYDILVKSCEKAGLNSEDYFIQLRHETDNGELATEIPSNEDMLTKWEYSCIEVIQKLVYTLKLVQTTNEKYTDFGMILAPKYSDKVISKLFIEKVVDDGPADIHGIIEGDEILLINEKQVAGMKPSTLQQQFKDNTILLTIKSSTTEIPYSFKETTDTVINDLVLPAPPSQNEITEDSVKQLIIPDPESGEQLRTSMKATSLPSSTVG